MFNVVIFFEETLSEFDCDSNLEFFYSTASSATIVFTTESVSANAWGNVREVSKGPGFSLGPWESIRY